MPESPWSSPDDSPPEQDRSWARQLATVGHVGMMFPVAIGLGFLGGWWLDGRLGTGPWLSLLGFALGVTAAMRNLIRSVRALEEMDQPPEIPIDQLPDPRPVRPTAPAPRDAEPPDEGDRE